MVWKFNACVCYFLSFHQMIALEKLWNILFVSWKSFFSFLRYSKIFFFFPFFFYTLSRVKGPDKKVIIHDIMNWLTWISQCNVWNNSRTTLCYILKIGQGIDHKSRNFLNVLQPEKWLLVASSRFLWFFIIFSIKRDWVQMKQ